MDMLNPFISQYIPISFARLSLSIIRFVPLCPMVHRDNCQGKLGIAGIYSTTKKNIIFFTESTSERDVTFSRRSDA